MFVLITSTSFLVPSDSNYHALDAECCGKVDDEGMIRVSVVVVRALAA